MSTVSRLNLQPVMINNFLIDVAISENHTYESDVTDYPVESGGNVTDNIRPKPIVVEMECIVSNTPVAAAILSVRNPDSVLPKEEAYAALTSIRDKREPVTIRTSLNTFTNMVLKNLTIPVSPGGADALRFSATFQQVITVKNVRTIRVSTPSGVGKKTVNGSLGTPGMGTYMVAQQSGEWYDDRLQSWRQWANAESDKAVVNVLPQNTTAQDQVNFKKLPPGHWQLEEGIPDYLRTVPTFRRAYIRGTIDEKKRLINDFAPKNNRKAQTTSPQVEIDIHSKTILMVPGNKVHLTRLTDNDASPSGLGP